MRGISTVLLITVMMFPLTALSQQTSSTSEKPTEEALREKAFNLLESLSREIGTLQSGENRARMGSNIAEALWTHNETKAREMFAVVGDELKVVLQSNDTRNTQPDDFREHTFQVFLKLRQDTVDRIAKHDPEFALAFWKQTKPISKQSEESNGEEKNTELELAKLITAKNPELALKVARQSLKRGISRDQIGVLNSLAKKSPTLASAFYKEFVDKILETDLLQDWNARSVAVMLAQVYKPRPGDDSSFRDLMNRFTNIALTNGCGQKNLQDSRIDVCYQLRSVIPLMARVDPIRVAPMMGYASDDGPESREEWSELAEIYQNGSIEDLLALGQKYPEMKDTVQFQAIMKARSAGDLERAQKLAEAYDGDADRKRYILDQLERDQKIIAMSDQLMPEIQKQIGELKTTDEKFNYLLSAVSQVGPLNRKLNLKLLNQATEIVDAAQPGKWQMQAKMGLAVKYCEEKSDRCFELIEPLIPQLNELISAAIKLDKFDNRYLRDGEWNMTAEGGVGSLLTMLAENANYFAWCDFDRSVTLASRFERPEIRMMAQLKIAQGVLSGAPKREIEYYYRY